VHQGITGLLLCAAQREFNLGLQGPVCPGDPTPPHARVLPVGRGMTRGRRSTSDETTPLSWLTYSDGAERT